MSSPLAMDAQQIAANAAKLDDLVQQRKQAEQELQDIGNQFGNGWKGQASSALQQIMQRFMEASEGLRHEEAAIAEKLDAAQKAYTSADAGSAQGIQSAMGI